MTTASESTTYIPLFDIIGSSLWPEDTLSAGESLEKLAYEDIEVYTNDVGVEIHINARVVDEVVLALPFFDSIGLVLGGDPATGSGAVALRLKVDWSEDDPGSILYIEGDILRIRFARDLLIPAAKNQAGKFVPDENPEHFTEIGIPLALLVKGGGVIEFGSAEPSSGFSLTPCFIGDSGCVIEADNVIFAFSEEAVDRLPASVPRSGRGLYLGTAALHLPEGLSVALPSDIVLERFFVGSGGFSGKATGNWSPTLKADKTGFEGNGAGELFGIPFGLETLSIEFRQNTFVASDLGGKLLLPFFDGEVDVDVGINLGGGFSVKLSRPDGFFTLTKENILEIELDALSFEAQDGIFTTKLSGKLTPLFGADKGLKWPTFDVKDLTIGREGRVKLPGGWLSLAQQKTFDFHGFKIEISQLGFGTNDNGTRWIGFSGGLKLVDGLQAGASVEGLRITWDPAEIPPVPKITLNGAGVELKIPGVLELKGEVSYRELTVGNELIRRFDGDIELKLETPEIKIDGTIVIGSAKGPQGRYNFFAIYVDAELPTGIPVANTGIEISGFAGLFALQMEPNKKPSEMWFSIDHGKSFYHRDTPGVTDLKNKWDPRRGSFAVGAGVALRTLADNGYTFNGKFLLAIVCPGPIVLFTGAAAFLTKQQDEGQFRALAVYDGRAGSVLIGLDAEYKTGKGGEMIEISGSMEAFYAFHDPTAWHLWLGKKEPREQRIRALFGRFVEANAYFMLDARQLALGAWFGYNNGWKFGPLSVRLEAWADGNAVLSFKPTHFHGDLWLHALVELKAFGLELGIALDARIAADLFKPYHLRGEFSVGIKLPWPIKKKIGATVVLEWGPRKAMPPLALPVKQVAVEHLKSKVVWPLPRETFLLPSWDDGGGFVGSPKGQGEPSDFTKVPVVPMDARISLTFGRSVHDEAKVGINPHQPNPEAEPIGPPGGNAIATARYALKSLQLHRKDGKAWHLVACNPESGTTPTLFGSWMPVPALPSPASSPQQMGNTKLLIGSKTPFDFTRRTGSSWDEWVSDAAPGYPCIPVRPTQETCFGFADLKPGMRIESPWVAVGPPAFTLSWGFGPATVDTRRVAGDGIVRVIHVLCFPEEAVRRGLRIQPSEPGLSFRIVLARGAGQEPMPAHEIGTIDDAVTCVDVRSRHAATVVNPWVEDGVRFTVRGADGGLLPVARLERWGKSPLGLNAGFRMEIELPCASPWVDLIVTHRPPFRIVAFNASGAAVATHAPQGTGGEAIESIHLQGEGIKRLEVHAAGNEKLVHSVCYSCPTPSGPWATWEDVDHVFHGPVVPVGGVFEIGGPVGGVEITSDGRLCLERICVTPDPEAGQGVRRDETIRHIQEELARWEEHGPVFAPHTTYRLEIETQVHAEKKSDNVTGLPVTHSIKEHAYFRTEGPPGLTHLSLPVGLQTSPFETGLEDLSRYVDETDPPTVPQPGEKPILFRPFYRALDLGVQLNENYVGQMYRMDRRDLGLYLFTASNEPARDARGRLLVLANRWGEAEELTLSDKEERWITLIDNATCLETGLDPETFPKNAALASVEERVLAPDTLYEARLIPLLFHETFAEATPGLAPPGWYAEDAGPGGPSGWQVMEEGQPPARHVEQASGIGGAAEPDRPGTVLLVADPSADWTDFRLSVWVRSAAGAVGVVFRYEGLGSWYRFALHERGRNLIKSSPAGVIPLAEDRVSHPRNRDCLLTVEAIGRSLRTYVNGEPVFAVEDGDLASGRIGLYACQSLGARFADVRVDDFGKKAPVVYRFQLTTSFYANFFHHLHSYQDELWPFDLESEPVPGEAAALTFNPPSEPETRAYEALAEKVLGLAAARQNPQRVEVTRLERAGQAPAFLLRSPEPIDWQRIELEVSRAGLRLPAPAIPDDLKLTDVSFGASKPEEETVTVLLREAADLTRHRLELWDLPGPVALPEGDPVLLLDSFRREAAPERFTIVDPGNVGAPSHWLIEGGALLQTSSIRGGAEPEMPGTLAVTGDADWTDYRLTADLRSDSDGAIGVVFRYRDENNHYRLSLDLDLLYRRLVRIESGQVTILWEEERGFTVGEPFRLIVEAVGPRLTGLLDGVRIFEVVDTAHAQGQVGLYASNNPGARCEHLEVRRPSLEALAWLRDRFTEGDLNGWSFVSETGAPLAQAASWETSDGALRLRSLQAQGGSPAYPGVYAVAGEPGWTDVIVSVRLRSSGGALGLLFRGANLQSYYRFSMSRQPAYRQLVKRVGAQTTVLWRDDIAYPADRSMELTIVAVGSSLRGYLDGILLFAVKDGDVPSGRIGLYAWNNPDAWFSSVRVWPAGRAFDGWLLDETFDAPALDRWSFLDDSTSWQIEAGELRHAPGPLAWSEPGNGMDGTVNVIVSAGREVFAGGDFTAAGGVPASRIAAWDGEAWSALGSGVNGSVRAIAVQDDQIYVGGLFTAAGGIPARNLAVWNRVARTWSEAGDGVDGPVLALAFAEGRLYVGGRFNTAGTTSVHNLAAWEPSANSWSTLGGGVDNFVLALASRGKHVYAGGRFNQAGGKPASKVARWDGSSWAAASGTINGPVTALALGENDLYVGGGFTQAGGVAANRIARWTGAGWSPLGDGLDGQVNALAVAGNQVWVGGQFGKAGGAPASRVARWSRSARTWSAAGLGMAGPVRAVEVDEEAVYLGGAFASPARRIARMPRGGTGYALSGEAGVDVFRLMARLRPQADGAAAVLFRWQDKDNHDALWLDAERGVRRLTQTRSGMAKTLWEDAVRPVAGREHAVTIDILGGRLTGYLDGVEIFSILDGALAGGRTGFAARRSPQAGFAELRIAVPVWTLYHAFGGEEPLLAGTRVQVRAGGEAPSSAEPGLVHRSAALTGEQGRLRLRHGGASLRIVGPNEHSGHSRRFLPEPAYSPVSVSALRKADGTGLFLFLPGDGAPASYRLRWVYHRDRKEAGRPFSQGGSRAPERVTLDLF